LVLLIAGFSLVVLFESYIEKRIAQELQSRLLDLAGAFDVDDKGQPLITNAPSDPRYRTPYSGSYWYVREGQTTIVRSRSLWDADIAAPADTSSNVVSAEGPDGHTVYLLEKRVAFGEGTAERAFVLGVALAKEEVEALSSSFGTEMATMLGIIGLVLFAGAGLQASYGLKPLTAVREQLALLRQGARERLDGPFPEEIGELTHDLNTLFAHQKLMIARARERAGALAHGLKTPMTILYGEARKLDLSGQHQTAKSIIGQLDLIRQQVDRELTRARAHGAPTGIGLHADVFATAERLVGLMQRMPRGAEIEWRLPVRGLQVAMDADDFGEVLGNLLDNARKWALTTVEIEANDLGSGQVRLSVSDDGPGIPDNFMNEATQRGSAIPGAGEAGNESSGLGLAIVAELVEAYGSALTIEKSERGGAKVAFNLDGSARA
jgi:signal transduction histidine kinase